MTISGRIACLAVVMSATACASLPHASSRIDVAKEGSPSASGAACRYAKARRASFESRASLSETMKAMSASRTELMASGIPEESVLIGWLLSSRQEDGECALAALEVYAGASIQVLTVCVNTYGRRDVFGRYMTCLAIGGGSLISGVPVEASLVQALEGETDPAPMSACSTFLLNLPTATVTRILAKHLASGNKGMQLTAIDVAARRCDGTLEAVQGALRTEHAAEALDLMAGFVDSGEYARLCGDMHNAK